MRQEEEYFQEFERKKRWKGRLKKIFLWIFVFSIMLSLHSIRSAASPEDDSAVFVASWGWDSGYLEWDESAGFWSLSLPGANKESKVTSEELSGFLPKEIKAKLSDGTEVTLSVTWDYSALPPEGGAEGSYALSAALPEGYTLGENAGELKVLVEMGGEEVSPLADPTKKYLSDWKYESRGGSEIIEDSSLQYSTFQYSMKYYFPKTTDKNKLIQKMKAILPQRISGSGYNTNNQLVSAGVIPKNEPAGTGLIEGYVKIEWTNIDEVINKANLKEDVLFLTFEAQPVSNPGWLLCVNSNNKNLLDGANDTSEISGVLNLTVELHDLDLKSHTVPSVNPPNTTVNLFDYWVDTDGALGSDILPKTDHHKNAAGEVRERTGVADWNKGINSNHLLIFGDGDIHAGFWNKGAGSSSNYGKNAAGMPGIVNAVLEDDGYPSINKAEINNQLNNYTDITDWELCGDHDSSLPDETDKTSIKPKNVSETVINNWDGDCSLDYLFDPEKGHPNKRTYKDATGLFQLDRNGYYYYDMRRNFSEYDEKSGKFILYDAPAVERTDANYEADGSVGTTRSVGNFLPFNKGEQVFDMVDDNGLLSSNKSISSNNLTTTGTYANHHLGMTVDIDFRQPLNGEINTGTADNVPMTFQFSGDDDVWIFIDDVLVLDLGGIHSELYGIIDFATGKVSVGQSWKTNGFPYLADGTVDLSKLTAPVIETTLKEQFVKAGKEGTVQWNGANGTEGDTFASNTSHTLKMFYLERGNYDSSLAVRFNLQTFLYQQVKKVDQEGNPVEDVEFELFPAELTSESSPDALKCLYTEDGVGTGSEFYVKQTKGAKSFVTLQTGEDGTARFQDKDGNYFNFADRGEQYYILKEAKTPKGYRSLPVDIVLYYDPDTSMLSVANRWTTGAYACSVVSIFGAGGGLNYGQYNVGTGEIDQDTSLAVSEDAQKAGLVVAVPMLRKESDHKWEALYGSNLNGFSAAAPEVDSDKKEWRSVVLRAALEQAAETSDPDWFLSWDQSNLRLSGMLNELPGLANRYRFNNGLGDMRMAYGMIEAEALEQLGIRGENAKERYEALGDYVRKHDVSDVMTSILNVQTTGTGSNEGFSFLYAGHFSRDFRSLIYIPNEQRELWVMKIDQDGKARNGARFGLYSNEKCSGKPIAEGITATVDGQEGTLIFSPSKDASPGHARITWETQRRTYYYLKEISAPDGCMINETIVPVVVGTYSIYADAGTKGDGVSVMAAVGRLTQTMRQYAMGNDVDITLRDITAVEQRQPSGNKDVLNNDWKDAALHGTTDVFRSMNLHFGKNTMVDYGLHDEDGGAIYKPCFVSDTGFIRTRVKQNYEALTTSMYEGAINDVNKDNLGDTDLTNLFSLLNIVVVTDETKQDTDTGRLVVSKMLDGPDLSEPDYTKNFTFTIELTDEKGGKLDGEYYFYGTNKAGYVSSGMKLPLRHDESITILGLPEGTRYKVTETPEQDWYPLPKSGVVDKVIDKQKTSFASFYNSKEAWPDVGLLILHKTVAGGGDRTKEFTFELTFTDEDGKALEDDFSYSGDRTGTVASGESVTLGHDETITILGIPAGTEYTVTEKEADQDGYTTTVREESGVVEDGEEYAAAYTNYKERPTLPGDHPESGSKEASDEKQIRSNVPDTGDFLRLWGLLSVLFLSVYAAAVYAWRRYRQ